MWHTYVTTAGLAVALLGLASSGVLAQSSDASPASLGVIATITTLDANTGMATLRTEGGEVFELPKASSWHVGHTVLCDRIAAAPRPRLLDCRLWEDRHSGIQSQAPRPGRFADTEPSQGVEPPEPPSGVSTSRTRRETDIRQELGVGDWDDVGVRGWRDSSE